jgi:hypothetical protein
MPRLAYTRARTGALRLRSTPDMSAQFALRQAIDFFLHNFGGSQAHKQTYHPQSGEDDGSCT